jgi:hypothetical protein
LAAAPILNNAAPTEGQGEYARRPVDSVVAVTDPQLVVRPAQRSEIPALLEAAQAAIGSQLAPLDVVLEVLDHDPDSVWAFDRLGRLVGGLALLFLTEEGVSALVDGSLNRLAPPHSMLVGPHEKPKGIYLWSLYSTRRGAAGLTHCFVRLQGPRYANADLWAGPNTNDGLRFNRTHGFIPVPGGWPGLHRYRRRTREGVGQAFGGGQ